MASQSISFSYNPVATISEFLDEITTTSATGAITHDLKNLLLTYLSLTPPILLNSTTTPKGYQVASFIATLSSGALTLDLTSLTTRDGRVINANGQSLQWAAFINPSTNANVIQVQSGASNGYNIGQLSTAVIPVYPGTFDIRYEKGTGVTIDSTHKNIDLAGTGAQTLVCLLVFG